MGLHIKSKVNGLVASAASKVGVSFVLGRIRDAAEGRLGPVWQKRYETASAAAPWTGLAFTIATVVLLTLGMNEEAAYVGSAAGILVAAGVLNKAYLTEIPSVLQENRFYKLLVSWAPTTTIVLGAVWAGLEACTDPSCARQRMAVLVLAAVFAKLGFTNAALQAKPPTPSTDPAPLKKAA